MKLAVDQAKAREHDASRSPQFVEPLAPVAHPAQLETVEACGGGERPLFEDTFAREVRILKRCGGKTYCFASNWCNTVSKASGGIWAAPAKG
jgi:hypothetical protein